MNLKELIRDMQGTTPRADFARQLGISYRLLSYIYWGKRGVGKKTLIGLARLYPDRAAEVLAAYLAQGGNDAGDLVECGAATTETQEVAVAP